MNFHRIKDCGTEIQQEKEKVGPEAKNVGVLAVCVSRHAILHSIYC